MGVWEGIVLIDELRRVSGAYCNALAAGSE